MSSWAPAAGARLALTILESLDLGILLLSGDLNDIAYANRPAREVLADGGAPGPVLPAVLRDTLEAQLPDARAVPGRFTPATVLVGPSGDRCFVRLKTIGDDSTASLLVTVSRGIRESDFHDVLVGEYGLTPNEVRVASLVAQGYRNREIAARMHVAVGTVKNCLTRIFSALDIHSRTELVALLHRLVANRSDADRH